MNCTTTVTKVGVIKYHEIYANSILDRANLSRLRPGYLKVPNVGLKFIKASIQAKKR